MVDLQGGLGNLLFQYAAGCTVALRLGRPLVFSERSAGRLSTLQSFLGMELETASIVTDTLAGGRPLGSSEVLRYIAWVVRRLRPRRVLADNFTPRPSDRAVRSTRRLAGYHQHPSYFAEALEHVLDRLDRTIRPDRRLGEDLVMIHLRRGDYVQLGWDLPYEYYRLALSKLDLGGRVTVISDDEIARIGFQAHLDDVGFRVTDPPTTYDEDRLRADFLCLSSAQHLVLANSTFSWWAGALGDRLWAGNPRQVTYPIGWLTGEDPDVLRRPAWKAVPATRAASPR